MWRGGRYLYPADDGSEWKDNELELALSLYLISNPGQTVEAIAKGIRKRRADCQAQLDKMVSAGRVEPRQSDRLDVMERSRSFTAYFLSGVKRSTR